MHSYSPGQDFKELCNTICLAESLCWPLCDQNSLLQFRWFPLGLMMSYRLEYLGDWDFWKGPSSSWRHFSLATTMVHCWGHSKSPTFLRTYNKYITFTNVPRLTVITCWVCNPWYLYKVALPYHSGSEYFRCIGFFTSKLGSLRLW